MPVHTHPDRKQVKRSTVTTLTLSVTCTACKKTTSIEKEVEPGWINEPYIIANEMKFTSFAADRSRGSSMPNMLPYLLCPSCSVEAHDFMSGKLVTELPNTEPTGASPL